MHPGIVNSSLHDSKETKDRIPPYSLHSPIRSLIYRIENKRKEKKGKFANENDVLLTAISFILTPGTVHHPVADVVRRHTSFLPAMQGRLGDGVLRQDGLFHDLGAEGRGGWRGGGGGGALAASNLVAVILAIQVAVASPVDRNASGPIALEPAGAYCVQHVHQETGNKYHFFFFLTYNVHWLSINFISLSSFFFLLSLYTVFPFHLLLEIFTLQHECEKRKKKKREKVRKIENGKMGSDSGLASIVNPLY